MLGTVTAEVGKAYVVQHDDHDFHMWDCLDSVGVDTCETAESATICTQINTDCAGIAADYSADYCSEQLDLVIASEQTVISDCWTALDKTGGTWADDCSGEFINCLEGSDL